MDGKYLIMLGNLTVGSLAGSDGSYTISDGINTVGENLVLGSQAGSNGRYTISGGTLSAQEIHVGYWGTGRFDIDGSSASITVSDLLLFATDSTFTAVAGSEIHMAGASLDNWNTNETSMAGLNNLGLVFEGGSIAGVVTCEIAGQDLGATMAGLSENYALDKLILGGTDIGQVQLVDWRDSMTGAEALYVRDLDIGAGSYLDLNGHNLYYIDSTIDPSATIDYNGGELIKLLPGDVDLDGFVDGTDLSTITNNWGQSFILGREFGDLNGNGTVDGPDYSEVLSYWNPPLEPTPEPVTLGLMLLGGLGLLRRRR